MTNELYLKRDDVLNLFEEYQPRLATHVSEFGDALEDLKFRALESQPCEDVISREEVLSKINTLVAEYIPLMPTGWTLPLNIAKTINELPSVTPSHEDLKEVYIKGYDYGVKDWFKAKTDKPDIKAEIIKRIEQTRDLDKNCGEYPYNRCIDIVREVLGDD